MIDSGTCLVHQVHVVVDDGGGQSKANADLFALNLPQLHQRCAVAALVPVLFGSDEGLQIYSNAAVHKDALAVQTLKRHIGQLLCHCMAQCLLGGHFVVRCGCTELDRVIRELLVELFGDDFLSLVEHLRVDVVHHELDFGGMGSTHGTEHGCNSCNEFQFHHDFLQALTPEKVTPSIKRFCANKKKTTRGMVISTVPAISGP